MFRNLLSRLMFGKAEVVVVKGGIKGRKVLIIDELSRNVDLDTAISLVRTAGERISRFLLATLPVEVLNLLKAKTDQEIDYQKIGLFTSDYSVENMVKHLKLLMVLEVWNMEWEDIAVLAGVFDPETATIHDIDREFLKKIALKLGLPETAKWSDVAEALCLPRNIPFAQLIDVFCDKQEEERFKSGKVLGGEWGPGKEFFEKKYKEGVQEYSFGLGEWIGNRRIARAWIFYYPDGKIVVHICPKTKTHSGFPFRLEPYEREFSAAEEFNRFVEENKIFLDNKENLEEFLANYQQ